jgi:hypothetical protein
MDFDIAVKLNIYETIAETTNTPDSVQVAAALGKSAESVEAVFQRLAEQRLLVLEPEDDSRIRMAPPFSGIETQHRVIVDSKVYYANCAWDAFGVAAALRQDAAIDSTCGDCAKPIRYGVRDGKPEPIEGVIHFAVPAAQWWDDIVYT